MTTQHPGEEEMVQPEPTVRERDHTLSNANAEPSAAWPETGCCMGSMHSDGCACGLEERSLRGWIAGRIAQPMTPDQREYCLTQIERVEGYQRADYDGASDALLARGVLDAWTDYCRDKGLI